MSIPRTLFGARRKPKRLDFTDVSLAESPKVYSVSAPAIDQPYLYSQGQNYSVEEYSQSPVQASPIEEQHSQSSMQNYPIEEQQTTYFQRRHTF